MSNHHIKRSTIFYFLFFILFSTGIQSCQQKSRRIFELLSPNQTGIYFINAIDEDEQNNVNTYMNIYTGAGVAAGDINNDGLTDSRPRRCGISWR